MRYTGVLLLLTALCFVSCTGKKDFKDGIVQLQSRPVILSKMDSVGLPLQRPSSTQ